MCFISTTPWSPLACPIFWWVTEQDFDVLLPTFSDLIDNYFLALVQEEKLVLTVKSYMAVILTTLRQCGCCDSPSNLVLSDRYLCPVRVLKY